MRRFDDDKAFKVFFGVWIAWAVLYLVGFGAAIWGVVTLINWLTSQNF